MNLNGLPPFDMSETWNLGPRWRKWIRKFDNLVALTGASETMQLNLLLHWVGPEVENIIDTFTQEEREDVTRLKSALSACFASKKDLQRLRYQFHLAKQGPDESMEAFVLRLKILAVDCDFDKYSPEEAIKSQERRIGWGIRGASIEDGLAGKQHRLGPASSGHGLGPARRSWVLHKLVGEGVSGFGGEVGEGPAAGCGAVNARDCCKGEVGEAELAFWDVEVKSIIEVGWSGVVEGFVSVDKDFEDDPFVDGEPVKVSEVA
ncbi:hypothetical protein NDU88_000463 [Pleurodeles waltl]|uniref:Retrotransposon gag domain-containing protein n=1 Tax=Pleurodeles waltl TaxID=8319 RepID=A0AAV7KPH9_PLEWA|nr:hypothetical protein NDU88_000463 [Pleurodeles waltl]